MRTIVIVGVILLATLGCKDEFLLESQGFKPIMVVDGMITNEAPPYTINLYASSPINFPEKYAYEGCNITLFEDTGNFETLTEVEPGKYITSINGIRGTIGNKYKLTIKTIDGRNYETEFQEMKQPVEIDSLHAEFKYIEKMGYPFGLPGFKFSTTTKLAPNKDSYILWNIIETYEYSADYPLYAIQTAKGMKYVGSDTIDLFNEVYWCWKTQNTGYILTGKTSNLTIPKIFNKPLLFVGTDSRRLQKRYSLLLKQYSITEEAYYFWNSIENQISEQNFLIATQPFNIIGNIRNIDIIDEPVYGYFTVASIDQKRIFVTRPNNAFYFDICLVDSEDPYNSIYWVKSIDGRLGTVLESCLNCTSRGGVLEKPDFWIDF